MRYASINDFKIRIDEEYSFSQPLKARSSREKASRRPTLFEFKTLMNKKVLVRVPFTAGLVTKVNSKLKDTQGEYEFMLHRIKAYSNSCVTMRLDRTGEDAWLIETDTLDETFSEDLDTYWLSLDLTSPDPRFGGHFVTFSYCFSEWTKLHFMETMKQRRLKSRLQKMLKAKIRTLRTHRR